MSLMIDMSKEPTVIDTMLMRGHSRNPGGQRSDGVP